MTCASSTASAVTSGSGATSEAASGASSTTSGSGSTTSAAGSGVPPRKASAEIVAPCVGAAVSAPVLESVRTRGPCSGSEVAFAISCATSSSIERPDASGVLASSSTRKEGVRTSLSAASCTGFSAGATASGSAIVRTSSDTSLRIEDRTSSISSFFKGSDIIVPLLP